MSRGGDALAYWYPKRSRTLALNARLAQAEKAMSARSGVAPDDLPTISEVLHQAQIKDGFPRPQIPRWLWVASRYRLDRDANSNEAHKSGAALQVLSEIVALPALTEDDIRDLNWVLESTIRHLASKSGAQGLRECMSEAELAEIERYLGEYDDSMPFDLEQITACIAAPMKLLKAFGGVGDLTSFDAKVAALLEAAKRPGEAGAPARAALRYLAEENDVVSDRQGVIGLIDDIYVVEWAYAAVESQTRFLPLLETMLGRWPFVGSAALGPGGGELDRYAQYVTCASMFMAFGPASGAVVVRETGAFPILAAVATALECAKLQADRFDTEMQLWSAGSPITISDGVTSFQATFEGRLDLGERIRYRIGVRDRGVITVGAEVLPYVSLSSRTYKRLSSGQEIQIWLKDRYVDPLTHLTGEGRRRPQAHEAVLLVGPRGKLDEYLDLVRPVGSSPSALLGARWMDAHLRQMDLPGSANDRPLIYACADAATACELIADPPSHVSSWRVIVDGARSGRDLHAALSTSNRLGLATMCVIAELAEREATEGLRTQGLRNIWYLEDQDVAVPPVAPIRAEVHHDALERFLRRQSNHWVSTQSLHIEQDHLLEELAEYLRERGRNASDRTMMGALDLAVIAFIRRATADPLGSGIGAEALQKLARSAAFQATALASYDPAAAKLRDLFGRFLSDGHQVSDRRASLSRIVDDLAADRTVAVVCRSNTVADRCRVESESDTRLSRVEWITQEQLRRRAPYDTVIVPGWIDRRAMREIAANGYGARTEFLLFPFEERWYRRAQDAMRRWERSLEQETIAFLRAAADAFPSTSRSWGSQTAERLAPAVKAAAEPLDDEPETDRAEARAVEALFARSSALAGERGPVKAQFVLFDEPGTYVLLPPHGHVIVLDAPGRNSDFLRSGGDAERRLTVSVSQLEPGMLLALPETSDRDLLDARADALLKNAAGTRHTAALWKDALKAHFETGSETHLGFAERLKSAGEPRDVATVRSWAGDTRSIAPRNYRRLVPLLAELTGDARLAAQSAETIQAIELVYDARARAAESLVKEIFSGEIDLSSPRIVMTTDAGQATYGLHRVERIVGIREVSPDRLGKVGRWGASTQGDAVSE